MDDFQTAIRRLAESGSDDLLTLLTLADLDPREDLAGLDLRGITLRRVNLGGADLSAVDLRTVDLSEANLERTNLSEANLRGANLSGASMRDANLSGADLSGADLRGADLGEADLSGSNLKRAKLRGAILRKATLRGARLDPTSVIWIWVSRFGLDRWFGRSSGKRDVYPQVRAPKFFAVLRRSCRPQFVAPALGWLLCLVLVAVNLIPAEAARNLGLGFLNPPAVRLAERRAAEAEQARRDAERRATEAETEVEKLRSDVGAEKQFLHFAGHGRTDRSPVGGILVYPRDSKIVASSDLDRKGLYLPTVLSAIRDTGQLSLSPCLSDGKLKQANRSRIYWDPSSLDTREFRLADLGWGNLSAADLGKATMKEIGWRGSSVIGSQLGRALEDAAQISDPDLLGDFIATRPQTLTKMGFDAQTGQLITSDASRSFVFLFGDSDGDRVTTGPGLIVCYCDGGGDRKAEKKIDIRWMNPIAEESPSAQKPATEAKPLPARKPAAGAHDY